MKAVEPWLAFSWETGDRPWGPIASHEPMSSLELGRGIRLVFLNGAANPSCGPRPKSAWEMLGYGSAAGLVAVIPIIS